MKKPKKLTADELNEVVASRKHKMTTVSKRIPSGRLNDVIEAVNAFASAEGVSVEEVKITNSHWNDGQMIIRRLETDKEKFNRVKADQDYLYQDRKYKYEQWAREQAYEQQRVAARIIVKCCKKCSCGCN